MRSDSEKQRNGERSATKHDVNMDLPYIFRETSALQWPEGQGRLFFVVLVVTSANFANTPVVIFCSYVKGINVQIGIVRQIIYGLTHKR